MLNLWNINSHRKLCLQELARLQAPHMPELVSRGLPSVDSRAIRPFAVAFSEVKAARKQYATDIAPHGWNIAETSHE